MSKKMIVICDDNAALAAFMQHLLRKHGFSVMTAGDGSEGLELVRATAPGILLLDLAMPHTDGLAVLEQLGSLEGKRPYTIVISGQESAKSREKAAALGSQEVWKKPFNAAELIARMFNVSLNGTLCC